MKQAFSNGIGVLALAGALALGTPVFAQDQAAAAEADTQEAPSSDIVVTARRRAESLQTTPVTVSALTAEALDAKQVLNISDVTKTVPGINFNGSSTPYNTSITLRGLSKATTVSAQPAVVTYLDEVPLQSYGSALPTFDLESVQVLKGPQGTYFGRNTTGGAILVTTHAPSYDAEGYGKLTVGSYNWVEGEAALNLPIVNDHVAVRFAGKISRRDGYTRNMSGTGDLDGLDDRAFRVSLLLEPTSWLKSTTVYDYSKGQSTAGIILLGVLPTGVARTPALASQFDCGTSPSCDVDLALARQQAAGVRRAWTSVAPQTVSVVQGIRNTTTIDVGDFQFKNIIGYRNSRLSGGFNADATEMKLIDSYLVTDEEQLTIEPQISGSLLDGKLDLLVGGFYLKNKPGGINGSYRQVASAATAPLDGVPFVQSYYRDTSKAFYGQLIYDFSDVIQGLRVSAAYRKTWDEQTGCSITNTFSQARIDEDACFASPATFKGRVKRSAPSYTFTADFQATDNVFLYVTTRRGNRGPGFNAPQFNGALAPFQTYGPEKVTDVEAGGKLKFDLGDARARFNFAAYRSHQSGIQSQIAGLPANFQGSGNPGGLSLVANFGKARIQGIDFDGTLEFSNGLSFEVNGAYTDAKYTDYTLPPLFANLISSTPTVLYQPKFSGTASVNYVADVGRAGELAFNATVFHSSRIPYGAFEQEGYETVNARIDLRRAFGTPVDVGVFAQNLFGEKYVNGASVNITSIGVLTGTYGAPRILGVQLRYRFND